MNDPVNHPAHYGGGDNPYEAIKVIEAHGLGFHAGNTVKYVLRARRKGRELEDLKKARFYLDRLITNIEAGKPDVDPDEPAAPWLNLNPPRNESPLATFAGSVHPEAEQLARTIRDARPPLEKFFGDSLDPAPNLPENEYP